MRYHSSQSWSDWLEWPVSHALIALEKWVKATVVRYTPSRRVTRYRQRADVPPVR